VAVVAVGHAWHGEALHSVSPFSVVAGVSQKLTRQRVRSALPSMCAPVIISLLVDWNVKRFCDVTGAGFTRQLGKPVRASGAR